MLLAEAGTGSSLYERLGGKSAIRIIAGELFERIGDLSAHPAHAAAWKAFVTDLLCQVTGGPCSYSSRDHRGSGLFSHEVVPGLIDALARVLSELRYPDRERSQVLNLLSSAWLPQ